MNRAIRARITSQPATIERDGLIFQSAVCECGTKIFPPEALEAHKDRHQIKALFIKGEIKKLRFCMSRMR